MTLNSVHWFLIIFAVKRLHAELIHDFYAICSSFVTETKLIVHVAKCQKDVSSRTKAKATGSKIYSCDHCEMVFTARRFLTAHTSKVSFIYKNI
jgi:hypothetical protein